MGVETMAIAAIAASAVATTASAISASSNNRRSIQAQKDLYEQQRIDQLSDYNERTGIIAQSKQLKDIGVNPASVFAGGSIPNGSMPSVPSVPSAPHLENVGTAATSGLSQMVSALGEVQGYKERDARVHKLQQEYETEKFNTNLAKANSILTEKYGDQKWSAELMDLTNQAYLKYVQGDLGGAEVIYKHMLTNIASEEYKMKKEDALQYAQYLQLARQNLSSQISLNEEKKKTEKSAQANNYASARQQNALAKISEIQGEVDEKVKVAKIKSLGQQLIRDNILSQADQREYALKMSRLQDVIDSRDYSDSGQFMDSLLDWLKDKVSIFK